MTTSRLFGVVALAFAAFTAACGSDGSSGPSFADSVSTVDAENFANGVADYASQVASGINFNGPSIGLAAPAMAARLEAALPPMTSAFTGVTYPRPDLSLLDWRVAGTRLSGPQAVASAGCTITAHGWMDPSFNDAVDLNANGIPDDAYLKYDCSFTDSVATDTVITEHQVIELAWKEISGSLYGQTIVYNIFSRAQDNHGRYEQIRYDIDAKQDIRSSGIVDQASFTIREEVDLGTGAEFAEAGESWNNSFDPAGTITLGGDIPDGALTIGGTRYYADSDNNNLRFGITTETALAYSAACAGAATIPPFTAGVLKGMLNNSSSQASFTVTFTACGNYTVAVSGAYDAV